MTLAGLVVLATLALSSCSLADLPRYGFPESASEQGEKIQFLWSGLFTAALAVGAVVWALMFWCFIAYRKRRNSPLYPKQTRENLPVEMVYTAIPFVLVAAIFYWGASVQNDVLELDPNPEVTVNVTAFKWGWNFQYVANDDNTVRGSHADAQQIPDTTEEQSPNVVMNVLKAENGDEINNQTTDVVSPVLVLPDGATIEYVLSSKDVVHAFWVPAFDFKRDVFPFPTENNSDNRFQTTLKRQGAWVGHCAELCGTYHANMNFEVRSVPPVVFDAYIAQIQKINPATNKPYTTAEALEVVQTEYPEECGKNLCYPLAITTYPLESARDAKAPAPVPDYVVGLDGDK